MGIIGKIAIKLQKYEENKRNKKLVKFQKERQKAFSDKKRNHPNAGEIYMDDKAHEAINKINDEYYAGEARWAKFVNSIKYPKVKKHGTKRKPARRS